MNTANTSIVNENIVYSPQQIGSAGSFPIFAFPGIAIPSIGNIFRRETEKLEIEKLNIPQDIDILKLAEKFYLNHKETLLNKYNGKYIAIINNKVVGYNRDFSRLAQKVYKKYGYQTIFMPFVESEERVVKIPSPRIRTQ